MPTFYASFFVAIQINENVGTSQPLNETNLISLNFKSVENDFKALGSTKLILLADKDESITECKIEKAHANCPTRDPTQLVHCEKS